MDRSATRGDCIIDEVTFIFDNTAIDSAKAAIWSHLVSRNEVGEYELVTLVDGLGLFCWSGDFSLRLFQKHFVVQHCLYSLRREHFPDCAIHITPLRIRLLTVAEKGQEQAVSDEVKNELADYYLDLENLTTATSEEVSELLANFWKKYHAHQNQDEHLKQLGLHAGANWEQIQERYRELAGKLHPDKGGDAEAFVQIRQAFEALKKRC